MNQESTRSNADDEVRLASWKAIRAIIDEDSRTVNGGPLVCLVPVIDSLIAQKIWTSFFASQSLGRLGISRFPSEVFPRPYVMATAKNNGVIDCELVEIREGEGQEVKCGSLTWREAAHVVVKQSTCSPTKAIDVLLEYSAQLK